MRLVTGLFVILAGFAALPSSACHLPAHPSAAAVPRKGTPGMILVEDGSSFYYLVPEGTNAGMKVVWDPAMHNRPGGLNADEYKGIVKEGIPGDTEVDVINGAGFFQLSAMSNFFAVKGNRGDLKEAFERESGADLDHDFVSDMSMGPSTSLGQFAKADQQQEFSIIGGEAPGYNGDPLCEPKPVADEQASSADEALPNRNWLSDTETITFEDGSTLSSRFFTLATGEKVVIHDCGIYMKDLEVRISQLEPEKYKAYIYGSNRATELHTAGIGDTPETSTACGPEFMINFTTPTINGNIDDSLIKIKVQSPPAGFELVNMFWVWHEDSYKFTEKVVEEQAVDAAGNPRTNADGTPMMIEVTKAFYELIEKDKKCSTGLQLIVYKPSDSQGFSAYRVYDTKGPIASNLVIGTPAFSETGATTVPFTMDIVDSNPYTHLNFSETAGGKDLSQDKNKLGLEMFYTYPTYKYTAAAAGSFAALNGNGLADLATAAGTSPEFKTYKHETQWFWKKAEVTVNSITLVKEIQSGGKIIGAVARINGQMVVKNPKPWHEYSDEPLKFAVFAMAKDSSGHPCELYSDVVSFVDTNKNVPQENANLETAPEWAFDPSSAAANPIPTNDEPVNSIELQDNADWDTDKWQKMQFMTASDNIGPEIQVVVFDTRTNRYHMFGTKKDVAAGLNGLGNHYLTDYEALANPPYLGKNDSIGTAHRFNVFADLQAQFDKYLQGPNAVSTVADDTSVGFVCQKNTRLIFYARAFDNNGYMDADAGLSAFNATLADKFENKSEATMLTAIDHVFRYENVDAGGGVSPYTFTVTATDKKGNNREFSLNIAVLGRTIEIRTLEERRDRVD